MRSETNGRRRAIVAAAVVVCSLSGASIAGQARADVPAVWVVGQQWNEDQPSPRWTTFVQHREQVCSAVSTAKVQYEGAARAEIGSAVAEAGLPTGVVDDAMGKLDRGVDELCRPEPGQPPAIWSTFLVIYMSCMMRMSQDDMSMAILLPPGSSDAYMEVVRNAQREGVRVDMKRDLKRVTDNTGKGMSTTDIDMEPIPGTEQIAGYTTKKYKFGYSISMGDQMFGEQAAQGQAVFGNLSEMTRVTSSGTIWAAQNAPGKDIVKAFYDNFETVIVSGQGFASAYGGMMKSLAGLVRYGMPMKTDTTVHSAMGGTAHSKSEIKYISVGALPESMCGNSIIPSDYKVTDTGQMMAGTQSTGSAQPGTGAGAANSADMSAAMSQMNEAMKSLTPEQRAMMEKMGMGGLIGGSAAAAAPASAGSGGSSPSSASMATGNLVQTVQNYLQALGYDPGPADGKAGTQTMIAISQFQAEKGMKVTGEVTPQLAGILAAEVDARR